MVSNLILPRRTIVQDRETLVTGVTSGFLVSGVTTVSVDESIYLVVTFNEILVEVIWY